MKLKIIDSMLDKHRMRRILAPEGFKDKDEQLRRLRRSNFPEKLEDRIATMERSDRELAQLVKNRKPVLMGRIYVYTVPPNTIAGRWGLGTPYGIAIVTTETPKRLRDIMAVHEVEECKIALGSRGTGHKRALFEEIYYAHKTKRLSQWLNWLDSFGGAQQRIEIVNKIPELQKYLPKKRK